MSFTANEIKNKLENISEIINDDDTAVTVFILWKKQAKEMQFSKAEIGNEEKKSFIDRFNNDYRTQDEYCPYSVTMDKTKYKVYLKDGFYPLMNKYIDAINTDVSDKDKKYNDDLSVVVDHLNYIKGYCVDFCNLNTDEHVYLFGTTTSFNSMTKSKALGMIGNISINGIKKISEKDKILGFKPYTTCFIYKDLCVINSKQDFENIFGLLDEYIKSANSVIDEMEKNSEFFQNISQLKTDLKSKPIYARSLVKFSKYPERINNLTGHLNKLKDIVENNPHFKGNYDKININDKGIVYSKDSLEQFLSLLNEKPVQSLITGDEFLANRDE